ncbi:uncharacterized protein SCHCODRAFT_02481887 [Schizophyllum commune H4-8]|nr:uncharacterized protein SCHCODRAFT_02481887 [Schizophyllum commune H4-8]KAI5899959.1 hypothetical protein SCHCODRAFT_02481887 [Schizophyllum commune H4-8]
MAYAIDHPSPATIILITGDRDFAYAVSLLRRRRYNVVLICHAYPGPHRSLLWQVGQRVDWNTEILGLKTGAVAVRRWRASSISSQSSSLVGSARSEPTTPSSPRHSFTSRKSASPATTIVSLASSEEASCTSPPTSPEIDTMELAKLDERALQPTSKDICAVLSNVRPLKALRDAFQPMPLVYPSPRILPTRTTSAMAAVGPCSLSTDALSCQAVVRRSGSLGMTTSRIDPSCFKPLVRTLRAMQDMGVARPLRTHLGLVMPLGDKEVYAKAGVRHFKQYICKAEAADLVDVGGAGPDAWVALKETSRVHYRAPKSTQESSVLPSDTESFSDRLPSPLPANVHVPELPPSAFRPLVRLLRALKQTGDPRPRRSLVSMNLVLQDPDVFRKAGVAWFEEYSAAAEAAGVVEMGGQADAWIALAEPEHASVSPVDGHRGPAATTPLVAAALCSESQSAQHAASGMASTQFSPLLKVLRGRSSMGLANLSENNLVRSVLDEDPWALRKAGVFCASEYMKLAKEAGIVEVTGSGKVYLAAAYGVDDIESGKRPTDPTSTLPLQSTDIAPYGHVFAPLIDALLHYKNAGYPRPTRSEVNVRMLAIDPQLYRRVRMARFKDYSLAAYDAGIVKLGGADGDTWIALANAY